MQRSQYCNNQSKSNAVFHLGFFAPFFSAFSLLMKERSGRRMCRPFVRCRLLLLNGNLLGIYFGVCRECPVNLSIGQGAVNVSTHYQSTILQNFLLCALLAIGKDFKYALKDVLRMHSVNVLLHILKTLLLTIYASSAHH